MREWQVLRRKLEELEETLFLNGADSIRSKIKEILPEYSCQMTMPKADAEEEMWPAAVRRNIA